MAILIFLPCVNFLRFELLYLFFSIIRICMNVMYKLIFMQNIKNKCRNMFESEKQEKAS